MMVATGGVHSAPALKEGATALPPFETLLARHGAELYRYAVHLSGNRPDADDLYQESVLRAYRAWHRLTDATQLRAWLYRIVTNTFFSERRKRQREQPLGAAQRAQLVAPGEDTAARLDAGVRLARVAALIERLPPKQRVALVGRKYQELSYGDLARVLGGSEAAARANVHAALRRLRAELGEGV